MELSDFGMQPYVFESDSGNIAFICNGEIYNFKELA